MMSDSDGIARTVGLADLLLLSVGGMIGSAVFYFPAFTGLWVGPASVLAWLLAGIGMLSVALCYTELSTAFPEQGGPAVFPAETFGHRPFVRRFFSYLEGVCYCLGWVFGVAISAWFVASYASRIPFLAGIGGQTTTLALIAIVASFAVTVVGINVTTRANLVLTAFILAVLIVFVAMGLGNAESGNLTPFFTGGPLSFLEAIGVALTGYGAWTVIPSTAEEVKDPAKTLPRAIIGSLLIVTVLYTVVVFVFQTGVAPDAFERGTRLMYAPLSTVAEQTGSLLLAHYALPLAALVAIFTTMLVGMTSAARVLLAMGRRGILPEVFATTHSRTQTPWVGLLTIAVASCVLVLLRNLYGQVVLAALIGTVIPYAINILAFVGLRYYRSDVTPTFRAPGGYVLPAVALLFLGGVMVGLGVDKPLVAGGVLGAILGGFVIREVFGERGPVSRSVTIESDD
jgi:APA family basic amino acid/polyamine antiporter